MRKSLYLYVTLLWCHINPIQKQVIKYTIQQSAEMAIEWPELTIVGKNKFVYFHY